MLNTCILQLYHKNSCINLTFMFKVEKIQKFLKRKKIRTSVLYKRNVESVQWISHKLHTESTTEVERIKINSCN